MRAREALDAERVRTTPRGHYEGQPGFRLLSPTTGTLDTAEVAEQASADPDQTLALLADMAAAADRRMAALAARLAGRLALDLARAGASSAGGACALRAPQQWSALAFGDQVLAIKSADRDRPAPAVVDDVLRLRGYGTTDLAAALDAARAQLERCTARRRVAVLLSDCRATAGGDPVAAARRLDELCVIAPAGDAADAEAFAAAAGARFAVIAGPRAIPDAVATVLQA